jgi:hypothetical protein
VAVAVAVEVTVAVAVAVPLWVAVPVAVAVEVTVPVCVTVGVAMAGLIAKPPSLRLPPEFAAVHPMVVVPPVAALVASAPTTSLLIAPVVRLYCSTWPPTGVKDPTADSPVMMAMAMSLGMVGMFTVPTLPWTSSRRSGTIGRRRRTRPLR